MAERHAIQMPEEARVNLEPGFLMVAAEFSDGLYLASAPVTDIFSESLD
jgi:hypothetical protein